MCDAAKKYGFLQKLQGSSGDIRLGDTVPGWGTVHLILWDLEAPEKVYLLLPNSDAVDSEAVVLKQVHVDVQHMPIFKKLNQQSYTKRTLQKAWESWSERAYGFLKNSSVFTTSQSLFHRNLCHR